ncbi:MAG: PspC domain-containing protein [Planctomycetota bacterium]|nr:PspC domain-containing protein [Planctomycetota bacterium]
MEEMEDKAARGTRFGRPKEGRRIAGVCVGLARAFGLRVNLVRLVTLTAFVAGGALALAFAIFDHTLFGGDPAPDGLRVALIGFGLLLFLAYPLLSLAMPDERGRNLWDFGASFGAVLVLILIGQAVGYLLEGYWDSAKAGWQARGPGGLFTWLGDHRAEHGLGLKDAILVLFFLSSAAFVWLQRTAVKRFFRAMHTGVTLVTLTLVAVCAGVLVPQIDGFEDPDVRVDLARERQDYQAYRQHGYVAQDFRRAQQYKAFRWAEGYFIYHLMHFYGAGMPAAELPQPALDGLERFGLRYGQEEEKNRLKQMKAAFSGREKSAEIGAFVNRHEDTFWRFFEVSTILHLNRTYKSHWFTALLTLLFVAVFFNTYKGHVRQWFTMQKLGFRVVHHGIMILLIGGGVSKLFTDRGILHLTLGEPARDIYWRHYDPTKRARLPFAVRLDHFARQDWKALEVHFDEDFSSRVPRYTLWEGREIALDYVEGEDGERQPRLKLVVEELHERVRVGDPDVIEDPSRREPLALAELSIRGAGNSGDHSHRASLIPVLGPSLSLHVDEEGAFRLASAFGERGRDLFPANEGALGRMEIGVAGANYADPDIVDVRRGQVTEVPGFRIRVVDATSDYDAQRDDDRGSKHPLPLEEQPFHDPAIWVDITPTTGGPSERRPVFMLYDAVQQGWQSSYTYKDVYLRLAWDRWRAPGAPRYLLHWDEDRVARLLGEDGSEVAVEVEQPMALPGSHAVVLERLFVRASFETNLDFLPPIEHGDGWDEDFYSPMPKGLALTVIEWPEDPARRKEQRVEMATTGEGEANLWIAKDRSFALSFLENSEMLPYEWRSVLTILERDNSGRWYEVPLGSEEKREIRVNDYFKYRGYRLFQTNADATRPKYSGIGVVYDPGIPVVLLGMYTIIAGTVIAFLIRPIVLARRRTS